MSTAEADPRPRLWAFHRDGSIVGIVADSEEAAGRALRGGAAAIRLKSTPPLALAESAGTLVVVGVLDPTTPLLPGYRTHDQSMVTLEDQTGSRWALRPIRRGAENEELPARP